MSSETPHPGASGSEPTTPRAQGEPEVEYLASGPGGDQPARQGRSGRKGWLIGGGALGVLAVAGAGAWGVTQLMGGGPGAAVAAPADTLAFVTLDLDPSAGQKVEAYQTLKKFPALDKHLGGEEDLRKSLVEAILSDAPCDDLTWADDFEPWLGDRIAAGVRPGGEEPVPYVVVQVTDEAKATDAVEAIAKCGEEDPELPGTAFVDDYMILAEDDATAEDVASATEESSLADDDSYTQWVDEAGGAGIVTGYVSKDAPEVVLDEMASDLGDDAIGSDSGTSDDTVAGRVTPLAGEEPSDVPEIDDPSDLATMSPEELEQEFGELESMEGDEPDFDPGPGFMEPDVEQLRELFKDFEGGAMVMRFDDGALELETAIDAVGEVSPSDVASSGLGDLPASTVVALGFGVGDSTVEDMMKSLTDSMGEETVEEMMAEAESATGLSLPEDLQTLLGDGVAVALDSSIDMEQVFGMGGMQIPAGIRISGDPDEIAPILEKLVAAADAEGDLVVESGDDAVAIGFTEDYVTTLVGDGGLGDEDGFDAALPELEDSNGGLFVDFDEGGWLDKLVQGESGDEEVSKNLEPLNSLGITGQVDDDVMRAVLRLSTD